MSVHNKVVWSEGLFLQPQHFQQQDRYFERYVETRCQSLVAHSWGFTEIEIERDFLSIGKFGLRRLAGVFPDGTPFRMPDDDPLPAPIDIGANVRDQLLYLAVPLRRAGEPDVEPCRRDRRAGAARDPRAAGAGCDVERRRHGAGRSRGAADPAPAGERRDARRMPRIPLAHVVECRADKQVVLEDRFIPTVLHARAAARLATLTTELLGLLHQRGEALSGRVMATGRGAAAEFADFLMLQVDQPLRAACSRTTPIRARCIPRSSIEICASAAGELATFTTTSKRPPKFPGYRHERLRESFEPVIASLRAIAERGAGAERHCDSARVQEVRHQRGDRHGPDAVQHGGLHPGGARRPAGRGAAAPLSGAAQGRPGREDSRSGRRCSFPGVPVAPVPVAPRQIPFHAGFAYFELDQTSELWEQLKTSGGLALHVAGEFPGLAMEFWAIRS